MGPKTQAALRFVSSGGRRAAITSLDLLADAVGGRAETVARYQHENMVEEDA